MLEGDDRWDLVDCGHQDRIATELAKTVAPKLIAIGSRAG